MASQTTKTTSRIVRRIKVALVCGGTSPEHEVSLSSGETSAKALDPDKYDLLPICIRKEGDWLIPEAYLGNTRTPEDIDPYFAIFKSGSDKPVDGIERVPVEGVLQSLKILNPDVILLLLHGKGGEDGILQGFLEFGGFCYTGPGVLASALAMDKIRCLRLLASMNYLVPPYVFQLEIPSEPDFSDFIKAVEKKFGYPCFVKPARIGSSVGMSVAHDRKELHEALHLARRYDSQILVEEFLKGVEVTCGVIDRIDRNGATEHLVLPPTEIAVKKAAFFDYDSKYTPGMTDEFTPARLPRNMLDRIGETAEIIYKLIGCSGMSRMDMILRDDKIYILECNTIPGMTPISLLPQGAAAAGIHFPRLLDYIIQFALHTRKTGFHTHF
ncbi:D-alanine--D-alanine ligase [Candidatus Sumerlaeota bacterium]|nr:D-alanine--D-alanine ligase [Candidatus Sumerlaeota bacterium]